MREALWVLLLSLAIFRMATRMAGDDISNAGENDNDLLDKDDGAKEDTNATLRIFRGGERAVLAPFPLWVGGHFLFVHQRDHGTDRVLSLVNDYNRNHAIPVDCVILDAFWWSPSDMFKFHPQLYPDPVYLIKTLHRQNIRVVLWMSSLVLGSDARRFRDLRVNGFGVREESDPRDPLVFHYHHHPYTNPLRGALIDLSDHAASEWFYAQFAPFVQQYEIDGVRCGGVDTLLIAKHRHTKGVAGHITPREYSDAYYRWFHDAGRRARGFGFAVVARPVDTFENLVYHRFAPQDVTFAGWVGDHAFSFRGLRDTGMNLLHGAQACYLSIGCFVGGTVLDDTMRLPAEEEERLHQGALELEQGVGGAAGIESARRREYQRVEASPITALQRYAGDEGGSLLLPAEHHLLWFRRNRELLLRWAELSAFLPFFATGAGHLHHPWSFNATDGYRRLVALHRSLVLFHAANAGAALASADATGMMLTPGRHHSPAEQAAMRASCPIQTLSRRPVHFDFPVLGDWGMLVGEAVAVFPVLDSFGPLGAGGAFLSSARSCLRRWCRHRAAAEKKKKMGCSEWAYWQAPNLIAVSTCDEPSNRVRSVDESQLLATPGKPFVLQRTDALVPLFFESIFFVTNTLESDDTKNRTPWRHHQSRKSTGMGIVLRSLMMMGSSAADFAEYVTPHFPADPFVPSVAVSVSTKHKSQSKKCHRAADAGEESFLFCLNLELPSLQSINGGAEGPFHFGEVGGDVALHDEGLLLGLQMFIPTAADKEEKENKKNMTCYCSTGDDEFVAAPGGPPRRSEECAMALHMGDETLLDDAADVSVVRRILASSGKLLLLSPPPLCFWALGRGSTAAEASFVLLMLPAQLLATNAHGTPAAQCSCGRS
jgi:hypothetical protein